MDREAWWATVCGVAKSWTRLSDSHFHFHITPATVNFISGSGRCSHTQAVKSQGSLEVLPFQLGVQEDWLFLGGGGGVFQTLSRPLRQLPSSVQVAPCPRGAPRKAISLSSSDKKWLQDKPGMSTPPGW